MRSFLFRVIFAQTVLVTGCPDALGGINLMKLQRYITTFYPSPLHSFKKPQLLLMSIASIQECQCGRALIMRLP